MSDRRQYRCLPLSCGADSDIANAVPLQQALKESTFKCSGVHVFYTFFPHTLPNLDNAAVSAFRPAKVLGWKSKNWRKETQGVITLAGEAAMHMPKLAVEMYTSLLAGLADGAFAEKRVFVLNHAALRDLRDYPNLLSQMNCAEYLLWDDGGLWETTAWDVRSAWIGAGWPCARLQKSWSADSSTWPELPSNQSERMNSAITDLHQHDQHLMAYLAKDGGHDNPDLKRLDWGNYGAALLEFLPPFWRDDSQQRLPCHTPGGHGRPLEWRGLDKLHMHLRHLLLDSWLSLWSGQGENAGKLYLQPASLAILYWAAQRMGKPFTDTPKNFLQHYRWDLCDSWFGGRWRGLSPDEKAAP